jgi:polysaccharide export outer membrane protein
MNFMIGFRFCRWQRPRMLANIGRFAKTRWDGVMMSGGLVRAFGVWCAVCVVIASCVPPQPFVWASRLGKPDEQASVYRIGPGDEIYVLVADQQALSGLFTIGPDGSYIQPVVGNVALNGLTPKEATQQLTARLAGILVRPQVTVSVTKRRPIRVSVIGEVQRPGRFELPYDESVLSALASAGGLTEFGDRDSIYVVRREPHLLRIRFRLRDLSGPEAISARFRLNDSDVLVVE